MGIAPLSETQWYRLWWTVWTLAALVAARLWIVQPIVRAQDRTTAAVLACQP